MKLINFLKFSSPIMDNNIHTELVVDSNVQNEDNSYNVDQSRLSVQSTSKTCSEHLNILDECENSWRYFYEKFNQFTNKASQDKAYDSTINLESVTTSISESIQNRISSCDNTINSTKDSFLCKKSLKNSVEIVQDFKKENESNQVDLKDIQLFSVINNSDRYDYKSWSSHQNTKAPDTMKSSECKNDAVNYKNAEQEVVSSRNASSIRINVSNVLEKIDRVDDIETNMYKMIQCKTSEKSLKQEEYKEALLNKTNLNVAPFLPKAFDIWSEKYRPLVSSEIPNADEKTINEKLFEIWHKIPPKYQSKYYVKAEEICKEYLNYKHELLNSSNIDFNRFKTSTGMLKPKALRFNSIENQFTECKSLHQSDVNQLINNEETDSIDYSKSLKKTMSYNCADKHMKKRISKEKSIDYDVIDENLTAAGYLEDILSSQQNSTKKSSSNCNANNSYESIINSLDFDMHELDCYLRGDNNVFETNVFPSSTDFGKYRSKDKRKRKKETKEDVNEKIKRNNISKIETKINDLQDVRFNKKLNKKRAANLQNETSSASNKKFASLKTRKA